MYDVAWITETDDKLFFVKLVFPPPTLHTCLMQYLKTVRLLLTSFNRLRLQQVARLVEMGFSRIDALEALRASNNDINMATNFLLQHWKNEQESSVGLKKKKEQVKEDGEGTRERRERSNRSRGVKNKTERTCRREWQKVNDGDKKIYL